MSDPAYLRTRQNIAEFGNGARATKLLRRAFAPFIETAADNRVTSRLTSAVMKVIKSDAVNAHGQRNITHGDISLLARFEFNKHAGLEKTFGAAFTATIDHATGKMVVNIPAFSPAGLISAPDEATHFRLKAFGAAIDFEADTYFTAVSESEYLTLHQERQAGLSLSLTVAPRSANPMLLVFGIEFVQIIKNGRLPLYNKTHNAMAIVKVDDAARTEGETKEDLIKSKTRPGKRRERSAISLSRPSHKSRKLDISHPAPAPKWRAAMNAQEAPP